MAFELKYNESLACGAERIAKEQIHKARKSIKLASQGRDPKHHVHESRKSLKKLRALLKLFRREIGKKKYDYENSRYRSIAQNLGEVRDADIMIETLNKLSAFHKGKIPSEIFQRTHHFLSCRSKSIASRTFHKKKVRRYQKDLSNLECTSSHKQWQDIPHKWKTLNRGLKPLYKQGLRDFQDVQRHSKLEHFHNWRKSVKQLWYAVRILAPLAPTLVKNIDKKLECLESILGEDHDLSVLNEILQREFKTDPNFKTIEAMIHKKQLNLRSKALRLGRQFYKQKASVFSQQFHQCWQEQKH